MDLPERNMVNAGILFMFAAWIQAQMSDLIIFKRHPALVPDFVANPTRVPDSFHQIRVGYWEKQFTAVKNEFVDVFSELLTAEEKIDAEQIYHLRNMIAHAHVSTGRHYLLYRPQGGDKKEQKLIRDLNIQGVEDQADPMILRIELWEEERFAIASRLFERFDQITLKKIANAVGVPHGRIR